MGFRIHHSHFIMPQNDSVVVLPYNGYGLLDNNYWQDTTASGTPAIPVVFGGDLASGGNSPNRNDATNLEGTNYAYYVEDNYYTGPSYVIAGAEAFFDGYYGCMWYSATTP